MIERDDNKSLKMPASLAWYTPAQYTLPKYQPSCAFKAFHLKRAWPFRRYTGQAFDKRHGSAWLEAMPCCEFDILVNMILQYNFFNVPH